MNNYPCFTFFVSYPLLPRIAAKYVENMFVGSVDPLVTIHLRLCCKYTPRA